MENKKFIVIGDSFSQAHGTNSEYYNKEEHYWVANIKKKVPELEMFVNGVSSRDLQTIIDMWIKTIPHLTHIDYLIIIIPFFSRTRLPRHETYYDHLLELNETDIRLIDRFIGASSLDLDHDILEFWERECDIEYFNKRLETQSIVNASDASQLNFIEIIEALKKITPAKTYIFSWTVIEKHKKNIIDDKIDILKQIGIWETLHDDYMNTDGEYGEEGNNHWGLNMNTRFADFIIQKLDLATNTIIEGEAQKAVTLEEIEKQYNIEYPTEEPMTFKKPKKFL